jgi:D-glycero-D-manno-heptose 1,7-bisphosphate phosphatase
MSHRAIFLDRDGVINVNRSDYVKCRGDFEFLRGVFAPIARLSLRYKVVVVTNQSAVGRGLVSPSAVDEIHRYMLREVEVHGGRIDGIFWCPHQPKDRCRCRKPAPGLLLEAAGALDIDLRGSYLIGDACSDIEAAVRVKCRPLLVLTGRGAQQRHLLSVKHYEVPIFANLNDAAGWISTSGTGTLDTGPSLVD